MRHALVIGKFYPPHAGHHLLIRAAAAACARVSVLVMAASHESIALADRVAWLRTTHSADAGVTVTGIIDDVPIDYTSDAIWSAHVALMRTALAAIDAPPVDAVVSSESYGEELARRFGARAVTLDVARRLAPVSGTAVRADPAAHWASLAPAVRAGLALRVVVLGAESTGTSTLATALAERFGTRAVAEYGRAYTAQNWADAIARAQVSGVGAPAVDSLVWTSDEFVHIARVQQQWIDAAARDHGPVTIADTDVLATAVWHERYLGARSEEVLALARAAPVAAITILTDDAGMPFEQDGLRDPHGARHRPAMTARFGEVLAALGRRYIVVRGPHPRRLAAALAAIDIARGRQWDFARPFG